ncbi:MAG TPA: acetyl-CoA carboxylase biotin carboxyl carrier protein [Chlamydiales bacterium]|nr:acetyl-CoA carboxylase biotin carboxyl carrier protein [Chlamydiales bacterium]
MEIEKIKELMNQLEASKLRKLFIKQGDFELSLEKEDSFAPPPQVQRASYVEIPRETPQASQKIEEQPLGNFVTSPMVGTFYASPAPDQPVFVKVGDRVSEGTVVCIIEAMKVMNEVKAGISGTVAEAILHNGQPVEFGSRLFRIIP